MFRFRIDQLAVLAFACLTTGVVSAADDKNDGKERPLVWHTEMEKAVAASRQTGKPILMEINGRPWCPPCNAQGKKIITQPEFQEWAREHVVLLDVKVGGAYDKNKGNPIWFAQFKKHKLQGIPAVVFLNQEQEALGTILPQENLSAWLATAKEIVDSSPSPDSADNVAEVKSVPDDGVRLPWHTTDLYWEGSSKVADVKKISVTFTVDRDIPDTVNLYIAPMGGQHLNRIMFYGGIQSNVNGWPSPTERRRVHPGPGAIFSRWGGEPVSIDAAKPVKGGLCGSAGYEGEFVSVRKPLVWKAGTYTWELRKEATEQIKDEPHTWFACFLKDHDRDKEFRIGALRFEGETFAFSGRSTSFVEIYATSKIPRSKVPQVSVTFMPPKVNGKTMRPKHVSVFHPRKGGRGSASPPIGRAQVAGEGVKVDLFNEVLQGEDIPPTRYKLEFSKQKK